VKIEKPSNAEDLPKLLNAELGVEYIYSFPQQDIVKSKVSLTNKDGKEVEWSRYGLHDVVLLNANDEETEVEGTDDVPFWAMQAFYDAVVEWAVANKRSKGDITLMYTRSSHAKGSQATFTVES